MMLVKRVVRTIRLCCVDAIFSGANVGMIVVIIILTAAAWVANGLAHALVAGSVLYFYLLTVLALTAWRDFWGE